MAQPQPALDVQAQGEQRAESRELQTRDGVFVAGVAFVPREMGEQGLDGGQTREPGRGLGGGGVVERFDGVVEGADAGGEPEARRGVGGEAGVVDDDVGRACWGGDAGFLARGLGVAGGGGAFGGAEGGGDGDVVEVLAGFLVRAVGDCFGRVDGAAAADADEGVDAGVLGDGRGGFVELGDGGVLFDGGEGAGAVVWAEEFFDLFDEGGLGGEGGAGYDEGFGGGGGEAGEEVR